MLVIFYLKKSISIIISLFFLFKEKPNAELIAKYANVVVDLLLSMHNYPDDFEFLRQILDIIREILDCDKSMFYKETNFNIVFNRKLILLIVELYLKEKIENNIRHNCYLYQSINIKASVDKLVIDNNFVFI
jgi:hypothetical protein